MGFPWDYAYQLSLGKRIFDTFFHATVDERISAKLNSPLDDISKLKIDVNGVSVKLDTFISLEKERLNKLSEMKPSKFQAQLPEVDSAVRSASALGIRVPDNTIRSLQDNFQAIREDRSADYWASVSSCISYSTGPLFTGLGVTLPLCRGGDYGSPHAQVTNPDGSLGPPHAITKITENHCLLDLDKLPVARNYDCDQCLVKYSGGPLALQNAEFINCAFLLTFSSEPKPAGKALTEMILVKGAHSGLDFL
jgi:hypothetical protein